MASTGYSISVACLRPSHLGTKSTMEVIPRRWQIPSLWKPEAHSVSRSVAKSSSVRAQATTVELKMNGLNFFVDLAHGQKTGIFLDQRENYAAAAKYARGRVLDVFTSTGGFAIHMARHDVDCVAHTHTPAGMAVSAMECGLLPLAQTSMRFLHIGYHDFEGIADDVGERERLVRDLGDHEAMVLRNHGLLVVGRTIPATFNILYRMERACEIQVMALSCNTKLVYPPQDVLEKTFDKVKPRAHLPNRNGDLAWPALLRKLDRVDTSYRN